MSQNKYDGLGNRMKGYEFVSRTSLTRRTPVIIRLDGKAFHTYTKAMPRPFYEPLHQCMVQTTQYLCEQIQSAVVGYTQSDEISILLKDWTKFKTQAWFDNEVQKIVSTSAAIATAFFNDVARNTLPEALRKMRFGLFDSRVFSLPKEEVCNYFIWRQQDATRNSINSVGQAHFSQKQLNGKNTDEVQNMLITEKNVNWNDFPTWAKRGTCVRLNVTDDNLPKILSGEDVWSDGNRFETDWNIPIFSKDRDYLNNLLYQVQE